MHVRKVQLRCTIEMLEHGECSVKPHVGTHGDVREAAPPSASSSPSAAPPGSRPGSRRAHHTHHSSRGARGRTDAALSAGIRAAGEGDTQVATHKAAQAKGHPQAVVKVPTAGTVMAGWAKDVGSWF